MKKPIIIVLVLFLIIGMGGMLYYKTSTSHPFKSQDDIVVEVKEGYTFYNVLEDLNSKGVIKNPTLIKLYVKLNNISPKIIPGEFNISPNLTIEEFVQILGDSNLSEKSINVTIPEGYTIEQIGTTLEEKGILKKEEFVKACEEYSLPEYIDNEAQKRYNLEGFLFPDTYKFKEGITGKEIIDIMHNRFLQVISAIEKEKNIKIERDKLEEIAIKASIIEREVTLKEEKFLVSSVIDNRIKIGMKLQIDATVLYAQGKHKEVLLYEDLEIESPYNTYYVQGMPIGAICNPGKDSIEAAIFPESSEFLFYITKDNTNHEFFKTYDEFLNYKNQ
ncbi:MAG: endolytic transglycosylase MltG [Cetobacterium sp.]